MLELDFIIRPNSNKKYYVAYSRGVSISLMMLPRNKGYRIKKYWLSDTNEYVSKEIGWRLRQFQQLWRRWRKLRAFAIKNLRSREIGLVRFQTDSII